MNSTERRTDQTPPPLGARLGPDASAAQVAEAVGAIWLEIDHALHPIVGHRGVAALYSRSLSLAAVTHPWLAPGYKSALFAIDPGALKAVLAKQTPAEATAAGTALFQSFHDLLASLVGDSLTHRLLRAVWDHPLPPSSAQDHT
jgi:hypothetical protein